MPLASLIREKHPGVYDDLSDDELVGKILKKFPAYGDLASPEERQRFKLGQHVDSVATTRQAAQESGQAPQPRQMPLSAKGAGAAGQDAVAPPTITRQDMKDYAIFGAGAMAGPLGAELGAAVPALAPAIGAALGPIGNSAQGAWQGGKIGLKMGGVPGAIAGGVLGAGAGLVLGKGTEKLAKIIPFFRGAVPAAEGDLAAMTAASEGRIANMSAQRAAEIEAQNAGTPHAWSEIEKRLAKEEAQKATRTVAAELNVTKDVARELIKPPSAAVQAEMSAALQAGGFSAQEQQLLLRAKQIAETGGANKTQIQDMLKNLFGSDGYKKAWEIVNQPRTRL